VTDKVSNGRNRAITAAAVFCTGIVGTARAETIVVGQVARIETVTSAAGAPGN